MTAAARQDYRRRSSPSQQVLGRLLRAPLETLAPVRSMHAKLVWFTDTTPAPIPFRPWSVSSGGGRLHLTIRSRMTADGGMIPTPPYLLLSCAVSFRGVCFKWAANLWSRHLSGVVSTTHHCPQLSNYRLRAIRLGDSTRAQQRYHAKASLMVKEAADSYVHSTTAMSTPV